MEGVDLVKEVAQMVLNSEIAMDAKHVAHNCKVTEFVPPQELEKIFDLKIQDEPATHEEMVEFCRKVMKYSLKTWHPLFLSRFHQAYDGFGLAGAWLTEALNTNQSTYEVAPVFVLLEQALLKELMHLVGWEDGDGIFTPGGSVANMYGLSLGRYHQNSAVKTEGVKNLPQLVCFTSEDAHYSMRKGALFLGLGTDNVICIKTDELGRMIPEELDKAIQKAKDEGKLPCFVGATSGTTVLGAFDPLRDLHEVCKKHDIWLHSDGAWGGVTIFSNTHKKLMDGIDKVDSFSVDLHKMSGVPFQCTLFITRHKGILYKCNSLHADYLFQPDAYYDTSYDLGDESIQCSRKVDCLKFWTAWMGKGRLGFQKDVDRAFNMAQYFTDKVKKTEGFHLVLPKFECTNICFWYVPPSLRGKEKNPDYWEKIAAVAPKIKGRGVKEGAMFVSHQPLASKKWVNFFRVVCHCHPSLCPEYLDHIIDIFEKYGKEL